MAQLAQDCGISKAALYHYFESKEAILFEALDQYTRRLHSLMLETQDQQLPPSQTLATMVRRLMLEYRDSRDRHVCLLNDMPFLNGAQRETIVHRQRSIVACLADAVAKATPGRFAPDELKPATMALFGMINFTFAWLRPEGPMSYEEYARLVIDLWLGQTALI